MAIVCQSGDGNLRLLETLVSHSTGTVVVQVKESKTQVRSHM